VITLAIETPPRGKPWRCTRHAALSDEQFRRIEARSETLFPLLKSVLESATAPSRSRWIGTRFVRGVGIAIATAMGVALGAGVSGRDPKRGGFFAEILLPWGCAEGDPIVDRSECGRVRRWAECSMKRSFGRDCGDGASGFCDEALALVRRLCRPRGRRGFGGVGISGSWGGEPRDAPVLSWEPQITAAEAEKLYAGGLSSGGGSAR